ncbi:MAG: LPS export ABC transporter permease LptG [Nitrospira sp.]|nr:LPS export ABC transporter permease LptG [Nitrospira sp.]
MMGILFWYIVRHYLKILVLCLTGLTTIYLVVDFFEKLRKFLRHDAELSSVFMYFFFKTPEVIYTVAPLAVLITSILAIGLLNKHHEITAMRSCGASILHVTMPLLTVGSLVTVILLEFAAVVVPLANARAEYIRTVEIRHNPQSLSFRTNNLWLRFQTDSIMHVQHVAPEGDTLHQVTLYRMDDHFRLHEFTSSASASFAAGQWVLQQVTQRAIGPHGRVRMTQHPTLPLDLSLAPDDIKTWISLKPEQMTLAQLGTHIEHVRHEGHKTARLLTDYWGRMAYACAAVIMSVLGMSIGLLDLDTHTPGIARNIGKALGIGFVFWAVHFLSIGLGRSGALLPVVAAWITCVMFLIVSLNLFLKVRY